jgi:hypothetical protein
LRAALRIRLAELLEDLGELLLEGGTAETAGDDGAEMK